MSRTIAAVIVVSVLGASFALASCELNETEPPPNGPVAPDRVRDVEEPIRTPSPSPPPAQPAPPAHADDDAANGAGASEPAGADQAITEQIRQTLAADEWLSWDARSIDVSTEDGVVTLRGRVISEDERYIVMDIAWETEAVRDVIDEIEVQDDAPE